jgi:hypothetical protein
MKNTAPKLPTSLIEAVRYFADDDRRFEFVKKLRWSDGVVTCPRLRSRRDLVHFDSQDLEVQGPQAPVLVEGRDHLLGLRFGL